MIDDVNELRTRFEQHLRRCADITRDEQLRSPSLQQAEHKRYPIPIYSGDLKTLPMLLSLFFFGHFLSNVKTH